MNISNSLKLTNWIHRNKNVLKERFTSNYISSLIDGWLLKLKDLRDDGYEVSFEDEAYLIMREHEPPKIPKQK